MNDERAANAIDRKLGQRVRTRRLEIGMSQETPRRTTWRHVSAGSEIREGRQPHRGQPACSTSPLRSTCRSRRFFEGLTGARAASPRRRKDYIDDALATPEGAQLMALFASIKSQKVRRRVVELVKALAEEAAEGQALSSPRRSAICARARFSLREPLHSSGDRRIRVARSYYVFTSESVSEGHPDKVADRISDTVVDAFIEADPEARVACETLVTTNRIVLAGEVRAGKAGQSKAENKAFTKEIIASLQPKVRAAMKDIGYEQKGFHWEKAQLRQLSARPIRAHRPGRRRHREEGRRRRRPGHHVRLRLQRNAGADAGDAAILAQHPEAPGRSAPLRRTSRARAGREEPSHAALRERQAGARRADRRQPPAQEEAQRRHLHAHEVRRAAEAVRAARCFPTAW